VQRQYVETVIVLLWGPSDVEPHEGQRVGASETGASVGVAWAMLDDG
jgi:hypothetical protein